MRLKDIIGLVAALVLAVGVAFLTRVFLTKGEKKHEEAVKQQIQLSKILVAARTLHEGDKLKAGDLTWQSWPQQAINLNYIRQGSMRIEDLSGAVVRFHVEQGQPLSIKDFVKRGEKGILAAVVESARAREAPALPSLVRR